MDRHRWLDEVEEILFDFAYKVAAATGGDPAGVTIPMDDTLDSLAALQFPEQESVVLAEGWIIDDKREGRGFFVFDDSYNHPANPTCVPVSIVRRSPAPEEPEP